MTALAVQDAPVRRTVAARIPMTRVVSVELQKMFDTRSGFWLMASIAITALIATGAVILFAPDEVLTYDTFAGAVGFPMTVILPMVAVLSVTSEWSQRSGLTTFTLVPHRGRVIAAKALACLLVGVVSIILAFGVGAVGNVLGTTITGTPLVWDISAVHMLDIAFAHGLGMLMGFTFGVVFRNSAGAIVAYFVYALVLPTLSGLLAAFQQWFADLQPWVDFNFAQGSVFNGNVTGEQWSQLAVSGSVWLLAPLAIGLVLLLRSEVK
jgi:ABC-2 type transport system permease protein